MGRLADFLNRGSFGPILLGMNPQEVIGLLGEPNQISRKMNPLILIYGSLELVFWKHSGAGKSQLREIVLTFIPRLRPLPSQIALDDFKYKQSVQVSTFNRFMERFNCRPVHKINDGNELKLVFLSGVVVLFSDNRLYTIRNNQKEKKETAPSILSDTREPTLQQIFEMLNEADRAVDVGALRAALMIAWAGMEATLRRAALLAGKHGQVGVQPSVLIRELVSAGLIKRDEALSLEELRQLRTAAAHGLAPEDIDKNIVSRINALSRQMLKETC
jgi:hypothetical protein